MRCSKSNGIPRFIFVLQIRSTREFFFACMALKVQLGQKTHLDRTARTSVWDGWLIIPPVFMINSDAFKCPFIRESTN